MDKSKAELQSLLGKNNNKLVDVLSHGRIDKKSRKAIQQVTDSMPTAFALLHKESGWRRFWNGVKGFVPALIGGAISWVKGHPPTV